jgi:Diacylglycerol kinase catalytic domain
VREEILFNQPTYLGQILTRLQLTSPIIHSRQTAPFQAAPLLPRATKEKAGAAGTRYTPYGLSAPRLGLLVNQTAGGFSKIGRAALEKCILKANLQSTTEINYCDGSNLAAQARSLADTHVDAIAVFGGDGSAHSVIEAVSGYNIPVLPLPGGTLNRLCHRVHGHANLREILSRVGQARPTWLSGGRANEHLFLVAAGFGPWMALEQVRETMRTDGLVQGTRSLLRLRRGLFDGQLHIQNMAGNHDIIIVAPKAVDDAFGLGKGQGTGITPQGLEIAAARFNGPLCALALAGRVLTKTWRKSPVTTIYHNREAVIGTSPDHSGLPCNQMIYGLVDGEARAMGGRVHLTWQRNAALVLSTVCIPRT